MAHALSELLRKAIDKEHPALQAFPEHTASASRGDGKWSAKQELGHLIDSATNNHLRFVRAALHGEFRGPSYDQNGWVAIHGYDTLPWAALVEFWRGYNDLLVHLVASIPEDRLDSPCFIGDYPAASLGFVIDDYVLHMQHHLDHILGRAQVTPYPRAAAAK